MKFESENRHTCFKSSTYYFKLSQSTNFRRRGLQKFLKMEKSISLKMMFVEKRRCQIHQLIPSFVDRIVTVICKSVLLIHTAVKEWIIFKSDE